ncbi:MAG: hypothetical protein LBG64_04445 [Pseudomonadales bacterium]|jgi:hypothetical protein|nr:hypothetical protein [Pseudomonadales bacterium]
MDPASENKNESQAQSDSGVFPWEKKDPPKIHDDSVVRDAGNVSTVDKDKMTLPWNKHESESYQLFATKPTKEEEETKNKVVGVILKAIAAISVVAIILILALNHRFFIDLFLITFTPRDREIELDLPAELVVYGPILSGGVSPLLEDLGFLNNALFSDIRYFQAGVFNSGQYQGARRIVATAKRHINSPSEIFIFAVDDRGGVFFDGGAPAYDRMIANLDSFYLLSEIMVSDNGIIFTDSIPNDHPQVIEIAPAFHLYRRYPLTVDGPYESAPAVHENGLVLDFNQNHFVPLENINPDRYPHLRFYAQNFDRRQLDSQIDSGISQGDREILANYLQASTKIIVVDQTGFAYVYDLSLRSKILDFSPSIDRAMIGVTTYRHHLQRYALTPEFQEFQRNFKEYANLVSQGLPLPEELIDFNSQYFPGNVPDLPTFWPGYPGLSFHRNEFHGVNLRYVHFISAFSDRCVFLNTAKVLQNVDDENFEQIGVISVPHEPLYRLRGSHTLLEVAYRVQLSESGLDSDELRSANQDLFIDLNQYRPGEINQIRQGRRQVGIPSIESFSESIPLLFFQDPWQRWLAVWTSDIVYSDECDFIVH